MIKKKLLILTLAGILACNSFSLAEVAIPQAQSNLYTPDKVADLAIAYSASFKQADIKTMGLGRSATEYLDKLTDVSAIGYLTHMNMTDTGDPIQDAYEKTKNGQDQANEYTALSKSYLRESIKSTFIDLYKAEKQLSSLSLKISLNEKLAAVDRKRLKNGLISQYEQENNYNNYMSTVRQKNALATSIQAGYVKLKNLMGLKPDSVIQLDYSFIEKSELIQLDYQYGYSRLHDKNLLLQYYENNVKRAKNFSGSVRDRYSKGELVNSQADLDVDSAELTYNDALSNLPFKYGTSYNTLMDMYDAYQQKTRDVKIAELNYKNGLKKLEIGHISKLDLEILKTTLDAVHNDLALSKADYVSARLAMDRIIKGTDMMP